MLKPDARFEKITDIHIDFLKKNSIKGLIIDVDNTLIDLNKKPLENIEKWIEEVKDNNVLICIASNSVKKNKIKTIAEKLQIPYVFFSLKPLNFGLKKAIKIINIKNEEIAEIGDQLFTDVLGAKRLRMFSILTNPISKEKHIIGKIKRKLEMKILEIQNVKQRK